MGKNHTSEINNLYHKRATFIFAIIGISIVMFLILLQMVLRKEAMEERDSDNNRFFYSTISNLNSNVKEISNLTENFNENNLIMLDNLVTAYSNNSYRKLESMPADEQSELLFNSSIGMANCVWIHIVDAKGNIIISDCADNNGRSVIDEKDGDITQEQFDELLSNETDYIVIKNPYDEADYLGTNVFIYCKPIPGTFDTSGYKYIFLGLGTDIIDKAVERMSDLSAWVNASTVGNNGNVFVVDSSNDTIRYGFADGENKINTSASALGFDSDVLTDRFTGIRKINGEYSYVSSRSYSSLLYGQSNIIVSIIPLRDLFGGHFPVVIWNLCLLLIFIVLIVAYSSFVRSEMLKTGEDPQRIRLFKWHGEYVYYSRTLGHKIIPIILTSILFIFLAAFYIQSLMKLSDAFAESVAIEEEISRSVEESVSLQNDFLDYYDMQYESRARLMAYIVELHGDEYFDYGNESDRVSVYSAVDSGGNRDKTMDEYNNTAQVINNSKALEKLKDANDVENIYLISDAGYTLATSSGYWNFSLSSDKEAQSYEFWDVLEGKKDTLIQAPMISDEGNVSQFIGCAFHYYTRLDANGNTEYVSYTDYMQQKGGKYEKSEITRHRGLLQIEINPEKEQSIIESAKPEYILSNTKISNDGFLIGFLYNALDDAYSVFYSPVENMVGKKATELGISENAFTGNYNGFQVLNGVRYLQSFRPAGSYYIATAMPTDRLYSGSVRTAQFCALFGLLTMFILSFYTLLIHDMDRDELYREETDPLAIFGHWSPSSEWRKSSPTRKFEILIKNSLIFLGVIFLAAILYEARRFGSNSAILYIVSGEWDRGVHIFSLSACIVIMILSAILIRVFGHVALLIASAFGSRVETMMRLFTSLIKTACVILVLFYCLFLMGINATRLLASAGIMSVVFGLGAQSLFSDLLAGIFIVMEGAIHVGDYISFNNVRGKVLEIGLRTTKYEDDNQNVRIICNNELKNFTNMSMKYSIVYYNIPVPYGEDYVRIRKILNAEFLRLYEENRFLKGIPMCLGIEEFGSSSVDLRVKFMCEEGERYDVQRFIHDQIMRVFVENDITIPFNQLDVHFETEFAKPGQIG